MGMSVNRVGGRIPTLTELAIMAVLLIIFAALAIPAHQRQVDSDIDAAMEEDLRSAAMVQEQVRLRTGAYASDMAELEAAGWQPSDPTNYADDTVALTIVLESSTAYCMSTRTADGEQLRYASASGFSTGGCG